MLASLVSAQDIIIMKNGDELKTKVTEVGTDLIRYKKFDNQEGPTYSIEKAKVFMIRYENGAKDVFNQPDNSVERSASGSSERTSRSSSAELPKSTFNINPLGLLQFGPIFQFEAKIGNNVYLAPHFRYAFAGVLTHLVWTEFEEDSELSAGTAAVGLGIKGFAETTGNTWYYGGIADLGWATARYDVSESSASEEKATTLSVMANTGYRWRSARGSYVNVGLFLGIASDLKSEERRVDSGTIIDDTKETTFLAMLELSFGWEF